MQGKAPNQVSSDRQFQTRSSRGSIDEIGHVALDATTNMAAVCNDSIILRNEANAAADDQRDVEDRIP
jgi:hypothetical protein